MAFSGRTAGKKLNGLRFIRKEKLGGRSRRCGFTGWNQSGRGRRAKECRELKALKFSLVPEFSLKEGLLCLRLRSSPLLTKSQVSVKHRQYGDHHRPLAINRSVPSFRLSRICQILLGLQFVQLQGRRAGFVNLRPQFCSLV